jgi:hypothetical protein
MTSQSLADRVLTLMFALLAAVVSAYVAVAPTGYLHKFLYLSIVLAFALTLRPELFVACSMLAFAVSSVTDAPLLAALPGPIYLPDFVVLLVAARGALPRDRVPSKRPLAGLPTLFFALWALIMIIAAVRATNAGVSLPSAIRGDLALIYWPLLYFGFTRIFRERGFDATLFWRVIAVVALGLASWMFIARTLGFQFNDTGLGEVPTGEGTFVRRNFGFAAAFIVYPTLALVGIAGMAHGGTRNWRWVLVAFVGTLATLTTLIRGEIIGLVLGALVILWLHSRDQRTTAKARTAIQLGFALAAAIVGLFAVSPNLGGAVVQRVLPFTDQAEGAELNADYRLKAVETGFRVANLHPAGLGVLDVTRLDAAGIDRGYLAHSGVATLLFFAGWPALISALLAMVSIVWRSYVLPTSAPWIHPAFVGILIMLGVYSVGAAGLAGEPWVIPVGALSVAARFTLGLGR